MESTAQPVDHLSDMGLYNYMKEFHQHPNSRMSITFNSSKGLLNAPGQNNCFLNSAVQVLWHLDAFRRSFRMLSGHSCMGNACIFCALKVMFTQFQYSDKAVLPPDALRSAMAETFVNQQRFQLGFMDDAAECFENILMRMHTHIAPEEKEDFCTAKHCIPHQKFTMSVQEQVVCECGATSEPFTFNEMVFYVSTGALVNEAKAQQNSRGLDHPASFSQLLKSTVAKGDIRECPNNCGGTAEKRRNLLNCPDVVSIGLVWDSAKSGISHIRDVVHYIGTSLELNQLFHSASDDRCQTSQPLKLVGVVCYYGKHYSTFFFHSKVHEWIYFDDAAVKQISDNWSKVCEKLCKGRHQPLLLLYMNPNTSPVSLDTAPKFSTMAPGYEWKDGEATNDMMAEKVHRSKTPGPDSNHHGDVEIIPRRAFTPGPDSVQRFAEDEIDGRLNGYSQHTKSTHKVPRKPVRHDSLLSAITKHSSDSSSSAGPTRPADLKVARQPSDAGSYSSRTSTVSSTTCSSPLDSDDYGYTLSNSHHTRRPSASEEIIHKTINGKDKKDKSRISLKKKKQKQKLGADVVRYQSSPSLEHPPLSPMSSYDDSSLSRKEPSYSNANSSDQNPGYATLPRKKKAAPSATSPTKHDRETHTAWMKDIAIKGEAMKKDGGNINSKIQLFNDISSDKQTESPGTSMPPESIKKPLLPYNAQTKTEGRDPPSGYIIRSNVEKILYQQRKAAKIPPSNKMVRPTHDQFALPDEYLTDAASHSKTEQPDTMSINSLKDSGYRSCGDRNSTSASSVSSLSMESPTTNRSFNFDSKNSEPEYSEVPLLPKHEPISHPKFSHRHQPSDDFEFPPPPSEQELSGNHCKQLSEASLLSEASTLKQRKTPSMESLDSQNRTLCEQVNNLSVSDIKCKQMCNNADDLMTKSLEKENKDDLSTALVFCNQAINMLSSALAQRPGEPQLLCTIQNKQDCCISRAKVLHSKIVKEKEMEAGLIENADRKDRRLSRSGSQVERKTMGDLHISNQVKRETASHDYTPLYSAVRGPNQYNGQVETKPNQFNGQVETKPQRSTDRESRSSVSSSHSNSSWNSQHQPTQQNNLPHFTQPQSGKAPSMFDQYQNRQPRDRQLNGDHHRTDSGSRSNCSSDRSSSHTHTNSYPSHKPASRTSSSNSLRDTQQQVPSDYIPPPKEFQAQTSAVKTERTKHPSASRTDNYKPVDTAHHISVQRNGNYAPMNYSEQRQSNISNYAQMKYNSGNSHSGQQQGRPTSQHPNIAQRSLQQPYNHHHQPTPPQQDSLYREVPLPPKTNNMSKEGIRNLLVQDMLKRKGEIQPTQQQGVYDPITDAPMWTPPQQTAYDRGISHYDQPTHHRQNQYGRVNSLPEGRSYPAYPPHQNGRAMASQLQQHKTNDLSNHRKQPMPPPRPSEVRSGPMKADHSRTFHRTDAAFAQPQRSTLRFGVN